MRTKFITFCKWCADWAFFPITAILLLVAFTDFPVAVNAILIGIQIFLLVCQTLGTYKYRD